MHTCICWHICFLNLVTFNNFFITVGIVHLKWISIWFIVPFSGPATWSVRHFHVLHFPAMRFDPTFSGPSFDSIFSRPVTLRLRHFAISTASIVIQWKIIDKYIKIGYALVPSPSVLCSLYCERRFCTQTANTRILFLWEISIMAILIGVLVLARVVQQKSVDCF